MSTDYSEHYQRARYALMHSYNNAASGKLAEAIRLAWTAEEEARKYAIALSDYRVEQDNARRAQG